MISISRRAISSAWASRSRRPASTRAASSEVAVVSRRSVAVSMAWSFSANRPSIPSRVAVEAATSVSAAAIASRYSVIRPRRSAICSRPRSSWRSDSSSAADMRVRSRRVDSRRALISPSRVRSAATDSMAASEASETSASRTREASRLAAIVASCSMAIARSPSRRRRSRWTDVSCSTISDCSPSSSPRSRAIRSIIWEVRSIAYRCSTSSARADRRFSERSCRRSPRVECSASSVDASPSSSCRTFSSLEPIPSSSVSSAFRPSSPWPSSRPAADRKTTSPAAPSTWPSRLTSAARCHGVPAGGRTGSRRRRACPRAGIRPRRGPWGRREPGSRPRSVPRSLGWPR